MIYVYIHIYIYIYITHNVYSDFLFIRQSCLVCRVCVVSGVLSCRLSVPSVCPPRRPFVVCPCSVRSVRPVAVRPPRRPRPRCRSSASSAQVDINDLRDAEVLGVGTPCQPFTSEGQRQGALDPRSYVTEVIVNWIAELAWRGCLVLFFIENSPHMETNSIVFADGYLEMIKQRLEFLLPFFVLVVVVIQLGDYVPHSRVRLFLRGMRRGAAGLRIP